MSGSATHTTSDKTRKWRIVADENMPQLGLFAAHGDVTLLPGREIARADVHQADVLLVRSVTQVDAALLAGSSVRFVGSATIGTDHLDLEWLSQQGIEVAYAPGCNAIAVAEYVLAALLYWWSQRSPADTQPPESALSGLEVAVVGVGNVGQRVARLFSALGMQVKLVDPYRQAAGPVEYGEWVTLEQALSAQVMSLHVPLTVSGPFPTHHLLNERNLSRIQPNALLINSSRGAVIDNEALSNYLSGRSAAVVLDVWECEPQVPPSLYEKVLLGTPHIAGYSEEGKQRGTWAVYKAFRQWAGDPVTVEQEAAFWQTFTNEQAGPVDVAGLPLASWFPRIYDIAQDHQLMAEVIAQGEQSGDRAKAFDQARKHYLLRRELSCYQLTGRLTSLSQAVVQCLRDE